MRLPRELDRSERQRCPRIYVPLCMPQSSSPTFAVMELVGFTSPSASADLVETPTPASLTASMADNSSVQPCVPFSPAGGKLDLCNTYAESSSTLSRISGREIVPQRSSDKPMTEIKVAPFTSTLAMKSSTSASQDMTHSVHMTTRGKVVHTTSMDFKDVVQKLTGAPGKSDDARAAGSPEGAPTTSRPLSQKTSSSSKPVSAYSAKLDAIKSLKKSFKLLHRRNAATIRSIKKLHAETPLTFQGSMQPAPSVSPVTPFTSFFDLACGGDGSKKHQSSPCPIISSPSHQSIAESEHVSNTPSKSVISCGSVRTESQSSQENRESPSNKAMAGSLLLNLFPESPPNLNQEATGSTFDLIEAPPT